MDPQNAFQYLKNLQVSETFLKNPPSYFSEIIYYFNAEPAVLLKYDSNYFHVLATVGKFEGFSVPNQQVLADLQKGLWSAWQQGTLLPILSHRVLLGSLYLHRGSPSKSSGPTWDILEAFIKDYYLSDSRNLPSNEQNNLDPEPQNSLKNFIQKIQNQRKILYFVKLYSLTPLNEDQIHEQIVKVQRIFPEESQVFCPEPHVLIALFSSSFPVDHDLYLTIFNRNLLQDSHQNIWKELNFGVLQNGMTLEEILDA